MKKKGAEIRKNIDVPYSSLQVLAYLATQNRMAVKNYMESILIGHAKNNQDLLPKKKK